MRALRRRSSAPTIVDPLTLSWAGYWEQRGDVEDFSPTDTDGGGPDVANRWEGRTSAGSSGGRNLGAGPTFGFPTTTTAIDGAAPVSYVSAIKELSTGLAVSNFGTGTAFAFALLVKFNSTADGRLIWQRGAGNDLALRANGGTLNLSLANATRTLSYTTGAWHALFGRLEGGQILFSKVVGGVRTDASAVAAGSFATAGILDECESSVGSAVYDCLGRAYNPAIDAARITTQLDWWRHRFPTTGI